MIVYEVVDFMFTPFVRFTSKTLKRTELASDSYFHLVVLYPSSPLHDETVYSPKKQKLRGTSLKYVYMFWIASTNKLKLLFTKRKLCLLYEVPTDPRHAL